MQIWVWLNLNLDKKLLSRQSRAKEGRRPTRKRKPKEWDWEHEHYTIHPSALYLGSGGVRSWFRVLNPTNRFPNGIILQHEMKRNKQNRDEYSLPLFLTVNVWMLLFILLIYISFLHPFLSQAYSSLIVCCVWK